MEENYYSDQNDGRDGLQVAHEIGLQVVHDSSAPECVYPTDSPKYIAGQQKQASNLKRKSRFIITKWWLVLVIVILVAALVMVGVIEVLKGSKHNSKR